MSGDILLGKYAPLMTSSQVTCPMYCVVYRNVLLCKSRPAKLQGCKIQLLNATVPCHNVLPKTV
jgi:hypothetical protein